MAIFDDLPFGIVCQIVKHVAVSDVESYFAIQLCSKSLLHASRDLEVLRNVSESSLHQFYHRKRPTNSVRQGYARFYSSLLSISNPSIVLHNALKMYFQSGTDESFHISSAIMESIAREGYFNAMYALGVLSVSMFGDEAVVGVEMLHRCIALGNSNLWNEAKENLKRIYQSIFTIVCLGQRKRLCSKVGRIHVGDYGFGIEKINFSRVACKSCALDLMVFDTVGYYYPMYNNV